MEANLCVCVCVFSDESGVGSAPIAAFVNFKVFVGVLII